MTITGSKLIGSIWVAERKLEDRFAADGTEYTMDYGITRLIEEFPLLKAVRRNSKQVAEIVQAYKERYPEAVIA